MGGCVGTMDSSDSHITRSLMKPPHTNKLDNSYTNDTDECSFCWTRDVKEINRTFTEAFESRDSAPYFRKQCLHFKNEAITCSIKCQASCDPENISLCQATKSIWNDEIRKSVLKIELPSKKKEIPKRYGVYFCSSFKEYHAYRDTLIAPYEIHLEKWDASWSKNAEKIKTMLQDMNCCKKWQLLEHIGSTAIPDLVAKPIVDLMIVLKRDIEFNSFIDQFLKEQQDLNDLPIKIAFQDIAPNSDDDWGFFQVPHKEAINQQICEVNIHVFSNGADNVKEKLLFRDFLISPHGTVLKASYGELKLKLMEKLDNNELSVSQYTSSKNTMITKILNAAMKWHSEGSVSISKLVMIDEQPSISRNNVQKPVAINISLRKTIDDATSSVSGNAILNQLPTLRVE